MRMSTTVIIEMSRCTDSAVTYAMSSGLAGNFSQSGRVHEANKVEGPETRHHTTDVEAISPDDILLDCEMLNLEYLP